MIKKIIVFLFGYSLTLIGLIYVISYLNLLSLGYNFWYYVKFIFSKIECLYTLIGIILMFISIEGGKDELYL